MTDDRAPDGDAWEHARAEQLRRWERRDPVLVEQLLHQFPALAGTAERVLDLIYGEVLLREQAGQRPELAEYVRRFPDLEESLQRQFAVHTALSDAEADSGLVDDSLRDSRAHSVSAATRGAAASQAMPAGAPPQLPGYTIEGELGRGGMGVVYQARHIKLNRTVALKMIRDQAMAGADQLARFRAEAEAVAQLRHPQIVQVYDYGEHQGMPYLSLEFVDGGSLEGWAKAEPRSVRACVQMLVTVARAVGQAHRQHIVHRDLKPANILIDRRSGQPKITDFGLAKRIANDSNLTHSQAILGTAAYMSPEQAWGKSRDVGPPTDVYALGVILYELLTGRTPFQDETLIRTLDRVRFEAAEPPSRWRTELPSELDAICLHCLAKDTAARYANGDELADDLERWLQGRTPLAAPARRTPRRTIGLVVAGVVLVLLAGWGLGSWLTGRLPSRVVAPTLRTQPELFAFLVGVRSYRLQDQALDLEYTESDVDELSRVLLRRGIPRRNIRLLTQWSEADNPELAPTAGNIRRQLRQMLDQCIEGDTVLVALTGMGGESGSRGMYCYLPADAQLDDPTRLLSLAELYEILGACPARVKLLLVDTCQSAALGDFSWLAEPVPPPGVAALFACSPHEGSYEASQLRHGVFSYHVLRAFEGQADANRDGRIELGELHDFARQGVIEFLRTQMPDYTQTPRLQSALDPQTPILPL